MARKKTTRKKTVSKKATRKDSAVKKMSPWVYVGVVVILLAVLFASLRGDSDDGSTTIAENDDAVYVVIDNAVVVDGALTVDRFTLPQPGFLAVHLDGGTGVPGVIVGRSRLLDGSGGPVSIPLGGDQSGMSVIVLYYIDDGDGQFVISRDARDPDFSYSLRLM